MNPSPRGGPRMGGAFAATLAAAQGADGAAFEGLYRLLAPPVASYLRLQGAPDPDDLTNEVFLGVFTSIGTFCGDEEQFRSWVFTIAHRRLTDDRRCRGRRPQLAGQADLDTEASVDGDVEEEVLRQLSTERVRALVHDLAPDQRHVLLLRLVGGLTVEQVAQAVGKSPTAVKALQRRGLAALRRRFQREGVSL